MNESVVWKMKPAPILVAGDVMVDEYVLGEVDRISPEAPVPVLVARDRLRRVGGAGNVVRNLVSMGGRVALFATVGTDESGEWFKQHCEAMGVDSFWLKEDTSRPTTIKTRVVARNQQIVRIDEEHVNGIDPAIEKAVIDDVKNVIPQVKAVIISDYGKGFLTSTLLKALLSMAARTGLPVFVDPKGMDYTRYRGARYITPNIREASLASGVEIRDRESLTKAGRTLLDHAQAEGIIITRGREGITLITRKVDRDFPVKPVEIVDVTGAGDTVVSTLALAVAGGLSIEESINLANLAASLVVSRFGAACVTLEQMAESLRQPNEKSKAVTVDEIDAVLRNHRIEGHSIVFTNGCFDLFHVGHLKILRQAKALGDVLVVGVNSDASVERIKGQGRPVVTESERVELISALSIVDYVVVFQEDTPFETIKRVKPDVLVKGEDWKGKKVVGEDLVRARGGTVAFVDHVGGVSTSEIIRRIRDK
ncbi:MAG: D-glycero-beta-D-manno-heptose 1-phosphate adenylyltransferase [Desulfomonilaceae bacterium]|nr:D-glycero-beta-D-manno-heptose 1-phosphate adenylyltransferase [Desulfomonilaceae bacterium]